MTAKHVTPEEFRKVDIRSGIREMFLVRIGEMSTGSEVAIPVIVIRGRRDGPRVFISAGTHGEEAGSIEAVKRFAGQITPEEVSGTLVMVPLMNAPAWAHRSRHYPFDAPNVADVGHVSGDADGGMSARIAYAMAESISLNADFALDLHSTHLDSVNYPRAMTNLTDDEPPQVREKRLELSGKLGFEINHLWKRGARADGFTAVLHSRGCPRIALEAGEGWRALEPFPSIMIRGIRNFCKATGALSGQLEMPSLQVDVTNRVDITVNRGGMSHLFVKPGDYVRVGQVVGVVRNMFDEVVDEFKTPINGIVVRCCLLSTAATGARICCIYETDIGEKWENRVVQELERQITLSGTPRPRS